MHTDKQTDRRQTDTHTHTERGGVCVSERECWSVVAGPIIYVTCARRVAQLARGSANPAARVAQFARGSAGPWPPAPLFTTHARSKSLSVREAAPVRPDGSLSLREGVLRPGHRPHYLQHLREAGRPVCERQHQSGRTRRSVCERQCWPMVADPNIYGTCTRRPAQFPRGSADPARRVPQFARGSVGPWSPTRLFSSLSRAGSLSLREAAPVRGDGSLSLREGVLVRGRRPHYLRHLRVAPRSLCERQCRSGETGRSVCERERWSMVADPIIYGTCAGRLAQFARGSATPARRTAQFARGGALPWSPTPLFAALVRGGSLSLREGVPLRPQAHPDLTSPQAHPSLTSCSPHASPQPHPMPSLRHT